MDPVAQQIGAVNTLVRQPDGGLRGYNTDWQAAIHAIEHAYASKVWTTLAAGVFSKLSSSCVP